MSLVKEAFNDFQLGTIFACVQIPGASCGKWDDKAGLLHVKVQLILGE